MEGQRQGQAAFAVFCLAAFAAVLIWFGVLRPERQAPSRVSDAGPEVSAGGTSSGAPVPQRPRKGASDAHSSPASSPASSSSSSSSPATPVPAASLAPPEGGAREAGESKAPPPAARHEPGAAAGDKPATGDASLAPSFDIVRVEATGETVIAGRGPAGATIDMLRDGRSYARVVADSSGLFAIVPPPLPPGTHEIVLQAIAPDGTRARSRDSVTISISAGRTGKPLVALTSPDRPTVLLSNPEPPQAKTAEGPGRAPGQPAAQAPDKPAPADPASQAPQQQARADAAPGKGQARSTVKIVSVEAGEGGRLYVSGQTAPGATIRLYLNDTLVAPGSAGADGKVSFAIGRGVRPGDYRIRLDDVDPVSGEVKTRAEVSFAVPVPLTVPLPPQAPPVVTEGSQVAGRTTGGTPSPGDGQTTAQGAPGGSSVSAAAPPKELDPATVLVPEVNTAIVTRGDSLWRISRRVYGDGYRYTVIYSANQDQIRNPNLIYPGQVFVLPGEAQAGARDNPPPTRVN